MTNRYPWKPTTANAADQDDSRYETPGGAQAKADAALENAKEYADTLPKYEQINGVSATLQSDNFSIIGGIGIRVDTDSDNKTATITATGPEDIDPIPLSKVYDAGTAAYKDVGTAAGNVPVVGYDGYLDTSILPALAVTDTFVVSSQAAMLALTAQVGDVAVRTDLSKSYILKAAGASTLANWQELLTPTSPVQSVAGKTGAVTLTASDVGLGNVTNESKATMFTSPTFTGTPNAPTASTSDNSTQLSTTAFVKAQGYLTSASAAYNIFRQAVINGNFDVWQRGSSWTNPSSGTYTADRWKMNTNVSSGTWPTTITVSRQMITAGDIDGATYFFRISPNGAGSGYGASAEYSIRQVIENGTRLLGGLNKKITVSLWAKSSISGKKIGVRLYQTYGTGGTPSSTEILNGTYWTLTSSWVKYSFTFTSTTHVGKTFGTNNDDTLGLDVYAVWGTSMASGVGDTVLETFRASGDIDIAQVQISSGDIVFPYHPRSWFDELALCQRYYEKSYNYTVAPGTATAANGVVSYDAAQTSNAGIPVTFKNRKRSTPTVTLYSYSTGTAAKIYNATTSSDLTGSVDATGESGFRGTVAGVATTIGDSLRFHWTADAEL